MKHLQLQLKMDTFSAFKVKGNSSPESKSFGSRVIWVFFSSMSDVFSALE